MLNGEAFIDRATCLIWEMDPYKAVSPYGDPIDPPTYDEAEARCNNLTTGGSGGWRVPNLIDLMLLENSIDGSERPWEMDERCSYFLYGGQTEKHCYGWTSTPAVDVTDNFVIYMIDGIVRSKNRNETAFPFCVRGDLNMGLGYYIP